VDPKPLRLTSVMGVARALLSTVDVHEAVEILVAEFGWDVTFQALALLRGPETDLAFGACWELLVTGPLEDQVRDLHWRAASWEH
jgi:hypothetical protein